MSSSSNNNNVSIPSWVNVSIYLALLAILAIFGDVLVWIVGFIAVTALFVGNFNRFGDKSELDSHH